MNGVPRPVPDAGVGVLVDVAVDGGRRALGRLLTLAERPHVAAEIERRLRRLPQGDAHVIGVTGAAGAGKSTTVAALARRMRCDGRSVAVLAVDPSSPLSGGALLGDRVRMRGLDADRGVYVRSMASKGALGGLARAVPVAVRLLEASGFATVLVETVGSGQSEIDVRDVVDTVVVLCAPGSGDEVQAAKAGLLEVADVYAVNKCDDPKAGSAVRQLRRVAALAGADRDGLGWRRPVARTTASQDDVQELLDALEAHRQWSKTTGEHVRRRLGQADARAARRLAAAVGELVRSGPGREAWDDLVPRLRDGVVEDEEAAIRLLLASALRVRGGGL